MKLSFEGVFFTYSTGVRALDGIDLSIGSGEFVAIVGENGAGKTTLVKLLNGLLRPDGGKVVVGNWDTAEYSTAQLAGRVGFLFQNPDEQLFERAVQREVAFGPRNLGFSERKIASKSMSALKTVGLADHAEDNPYDLAPFERKLLALAATLAMDTPVLVLDEPSIGQDAAGRRRIGRILRELHTMGSTILLISHDLDFCAEYAERAVVMANGHILADGLVEKIFAQNDLLQRAAVFPPQLVRLAQALKMPTAPLKVDQFVNAYSQWHRRKKRA
ncbi:MAG: energy-coupling factor ABC transporter ATP-binding protein [Chloroflexi bacterium]|nr:energy-coupling factor ABC transporter ATP-binding protein [Chloroflexota bacterium]